MNTRYKLPCNARMSASHCILLSHFTNLGIQIIRLVVEVMARKRFLALHSMHVDVLGWCRYTAILKGVTNRPLGHGLAALSFYNDLATFFCVFKKLVVYFVCT